MSCAAEKQQPAVFHREALKDSAPERHLRVQLELEDESVKPSEVELKFFIISGLRSLHGEVGAALNFDLLKYDEDSRVALLRVSKEGLVKLWSSLTLLGSYQNHRCAFRVLQDLELFSALTGDTNPLHLDPDFTRTTAFSRPVVHGVLVNGLISALLGSNSPGCVLVKQEIRFPAPLFLDEPVQAQAEVRRVRLSTALVSVSVRTQDRDQRVVLEGTVTVRIHRTQEDS